jgi:hypothetical protein
VSIHFTVRSCFGTLPPGFGSKTANDLFALEVGCLLDWADGQSFQCVKALQNDALAALITQAVPKFWSAIMFLQYSGQITLE